MLWVNHENYFGPDRRRKRGGLRIRERRRYDYAGSPPPLPTALRQLRMYVLSAEGPALLAFAERARATASLAHMQGEANAAAALTALAVNAARAGDRDVRQSLYHALDRVHAALRNV